MLAIIITIHLNITRPQSSHSLGYSQTPQASSKTWSVLDFPAFWPKEEDSWETQQILKKPQV